MLVSLSSCSTSEPEPTGLSENDARAIFENLIYLDVLNSPIESIQLVGSDWLVKLTNNRTYTMDSESSLIYCIREEGKTINCEFGYISFLENNIIIDTEGEFSCIPTMHKGNCSDEFIESYDLLKEKFLNSS